MARKIEVIKAEPNSRAWDVECYGNHNFVTGYGLLAKNTNNPEYERLRSNQYMEALRDRTVKVDVPYTLRWGEELKILEKD